MSIDKDSSRCDLNFLFGIFKKNEYESIFLDQRLILSMIIMNLYLNLT